jgi:hypothetical protein
VRGVGRAVRDDRMAATASGLDRGRNIGSGSRDGRGGGPVGPGSGLPLRPTAARAAHPRDGRCGIWAAILYGGDTIPIPGRWARAVLGQAFFVAWVVISLTGMVAGITLTQDPQAPGLLIFFAACLFWTVPYLVLASQRRTPIWIIIGLVSIAVAGFGIVYLIVNPIPCGCD